MLGTKASRALLGILGAFNPLVTRAWQQAEHIELMGKRLELMGMPSARAQKLTQACRRYSMAAPGHLVQDGTIAIAQAYARRHADVFDVHRITEAFHGLIADPLRAQAMAIFDRLLFSDLEGMITG